MVDSVEQLPDAAQRIRAILETGVTVVVTPTHRLHIDDEQVLRVDGLGTSARTLFIQRARIVDPYFDETRPDLGRLLVRLDGAVSGRG